MDTLYEVFRALALLSAANATPIVVARVAGDRLAAPLDLAKVLPDGERLFGSHKTWRGLISGIAMCSAVGLLFNLSAGLGATFGCVSLLGDALSSAVKRRLHLQPGKECTGLDQFGEVVLPLILFAKPLSLELSDIVIVLLAFVVLGFATTRLRHRRRSL